jgi:hypothetical protein
VTTFLDLSRRLVLERGISVHPVIPGDKCPGRYGSGRWWPLSVSEYKLRLPTEEELALWASWPEAGLAVLACPLSGVVAVDFDHRPDLHRAVAALLPETPVKKRGEKGLTWFFRHSGEENKKWSLGGEVVVEVLANHSCTVPPSVHPTGLLYEWDGPGLADVDKADLPVLPADLPDRLTQFFAAFEPKRRVPAPAIERPAYVPRPDELEEVDRALDCVSPDDYETWVQVGMAIRSKFPGADGFMAWDRWSRRSPKYHKNRPGEMNRKWGSFSGEGVNLGTVFHLARENGYRPPARQPTSPSPVDLSGFLGGVKENQASPEKERQEDPPAPSFALPVDLLTSAPGLVGDVAVWLTVNNFYHQHAYSLAAALSFVGVLKAHRVCTEEDARTNLLTVAVGPSTSGKSSPLKRLMSLAASAGVFDRMNGEPASEQALIKGLVDSGHKALVLWDEMGLALKAMFSTTAPSYKAGIVRTLLKVYSMADETMLGFQYANHDGKTPRVDLHQPCLCLYGTTTPEGIYGAFSSVEAINGFAARLLLFETHDYVAKRHKGTKIPPPPELLDRIRAAAGLTDPAPAGNLAGVGVIAPRTVPYDDDARRLVDLAGERFEGLKNQAIRGRRRADESIWGRAYEHMVKVALTVEDGPAITAASVRWAFDLVERLCKNMVVAARDQIADNQTHAEVNSVLRIIRDAHPGWLSLSDIYKKTRGMPRQKRTDHLAQLLEEGTIECDEQTTGGRTRKLYRYLNST